MTSACGSMDSRPVADSNVTTVKTSCESFFVYDMCMTDSTRDGRVDYAWFADDREIFLYRPGVPLPEALPLHRCAMAIGDKVAEYGSRLLYDEDLNLLQEMDVKRKLLVNYMAAKSRVDDCYGGDSRSGQRGDVAET